MKIKGNTQAFYADYY